MESNWTAEGAARPFSFDIAYYAFVDEAAGVFVYRRETLSPFIKKLSTNDGGFLP